MEKKMPTFQKKHHRCYKWRRNCPLFRSNTTGATSGEGTTTIQK
jgi:hypothetical protein